MLFCTFSLSIYPSLTLDLTLLQSLVALYIPIVCTVLYYMIHSLSYSKFKKQGTEYSTYNTYPLPVGNLQQPPKQKKFERQRENNLDNLK